MGVFKTTVGSYNGRPNPQSGMDLGICIRIWACCLGVAGLCGDVPLAVTFSCGGIPWYSVHPFFSGAIALAGLLCDTACTNALPEGYSREGGFGRTNVLDCRRFFLWGRAW